MKEIGFIAEENLAKLIAEPLLIDFVHLSPTCLEGEKERELCDILIEDAPLAIATEIKFQDKAKAKFTRNEKSWAEKQLKTAARQIRGAIKNIGKTKITAKHPYRGKVSFSAGELRCEHGLIIVD